MASRARASKRREKTHAMGFIGLAIVIAILLAFFATLVSCFRLADSWLEDLPNYQNADAYLSGEPTKILDADGNVIAELFLQNRRSVPLDKISPYVLKGTIDTEDKRFYEHDGVDPVGVLRAAAGQITGTSAEGGSTITQQLVRNTILSDEQFEKTLRRKVREAYISFELEKTYSKDEILSMYLNTVYYGQGAYGIQAASQTYFSKDAADLTLSEAALLAGLPQAPTKLNPIQNPDGATKRRNTVLNRMLSMGDITQEEHDAAISEEIALKPSEYQQSGAYAYPYFVDYVTGLLQKQFPKDTIFKGGLTVQTTIDPKLQQYAEDAVKARMDWAGNPDLESALVSIDPSNGYIKAMVGGKDYNESQFNIATQARRQAGSTFKVFTLTAAVEEGMSPETVYNGNSPITIDGWTVRNFANENWGNITLRNATIYSSNTVYAQVINKLGAGRVADTAHRMGITSELPPYLSITLGTMGVSPLEMANSYATLAAGGIHRDPVAISEIKDRKGNVIYTAPDTQQQVINTEVCDSVTAVLEDLVKSSHGNFGKPNVNQPCAAKTGTTQNNRDLWYVGYTPQLATAVWTGCREEETIKIHGRVAFSEITCGPIFKEFMTNALEGQARKEFPHSTKKQSFKDQSYWNTGVKVETEEERQAREAQEQKESEEKKQQEQSAADPLKAPTIEERISRYQQLGYSVSYEEAYSDSVAAGEIIGTKANDAEKKVVVYTSKGPKPGQ